MTPDADDRMMRRLRELPVIAPDPARSARVRERCHVRLARHQRRAERAADVRRFSSLALERALIYSLCMGYLVGMIDDLVRLVVR